MCAVSGINFNKRAELVPFSFHAELFKLENFPPYACCRHLNDTIGRKFAIWRGPLFPRPMNIDWSPGRRLVLLAVGDPVNTDMSRLLISACSSQNPAKYDAMGHFRRAHDAVA